MINQLLRGAYTIALIILYSGVVTGISRTTDVLCLRQGQTPWNKAELRKALDSRQPA